MHKYRVAPKERRTAPDGTVFDSLGEMKRYHDLLLLVKSQEISDMRRQVVYPLSVNGMLICKFVADFVYMKSGNEIVEDFKGMRTPVFNLKKKLMKAIYGIDILITGSPPGGCKTRRALK